MEDGGTCPFLPRTARLGDERSTGGKEPGTVKMWPCSSRPRERAGKPGLMVSRSGRFHPVQRWELVLEPSKVQPIRVIISQGEWFRSSMESLAQEHWGGSG